MYISYYIQEGAFLNGYIALWTDAKIVFKFLNLCKEEYYSILIYKQAYRDDRICKHNTPTSSTVGLLPEVGN